MTEQQFDPNTYKSYNPEDIDNIAEYISLHAKSIGVISSDADIRDHSALYEAIRKKGVEVDELAYLADQQKPVHDCALVVDPDCGINFVAWQTFFILPTLQDFTTYTKRLEDGRLEYPPLQLNQVNSETWWWSKQNSKFFEQYEPTAYQKPKFLEPFEGDAIKLYKHCILYLHPELKPHYHRIYPIYAGAQSELAIDKLPFRTLVEKVSMAFKLGYDKIFFVNSEETLQDQSVFKSHRVVRYFPDKPASTWFHVTACLDGQAQYHKLCEHYGTKPIMNIVSGYRFENVVLDSMPTVPHWELADFIEEIEYTPAPRPKKFVCFNRVPRWHRIRLLAFMFEKKLVQLGHYSFDMSEAHGGAELKETWAPDFDHGRQEDQQSHYSEPYLDNIYKNWEQLPLILNRTNSRDNPVDLNADDVSYHTDSYFSIVCETTFFHSIGRSCKPMSLTHSDGVFISEKLYKPLAYKHPFVCLGMPKTLYYLRKVGYQTFHPYIDESYDDMVDDEQRFEAICNEIERLCNLSDSEWVELMKKLQPIVEHNQRWLATEKPLNSTPYNILEYFE